MLHGSGVQEQLNAVVDCLAYLSNIMDLIDPMPLIVGLRQSLCTPHVVVLEYHYHIVLRVSNFAHIYDGMELVVAPAAGSASNFQCNFQVQCLCKYC